MRFLVSLPILLLALVSTASAQFNGFFDQMFGGGGGGHRQQRQPQNVPSDPSVYQNNYAHSHCDKYLCPDTLGTTSPEPAPIPLPHSVEEEERRGTAHS